MPIGESVIVRMDTVRAADIMVVMNTTGNTGIMMSTETMGVLMDMEGIDHVEIYQTVSVFCYYCGFIYDLRGTHGFDSAGYYEPDCG